MASQGEENANPYRSPSQATRPDGPRLMTWARALVLVIVTAAVAGVAGAGIGAALGSLVPGYYRSVFPSGDSPTFDPVAVGIGQGLTQGIALGAIVGVGIAAIVAWAKSRRNRQ